MKSIVLLVVPVKRFYVLKILLKAVIDIYDTDKVDKKPSWVLLIMAVNIYFSETCDFRI